MIKSESNSEVARLRQQIADEYEAAERALHDPAMVASHAFITARQERICVCVRELAGMVGIDEASHIFAEAVEGIVVV